MRALDDSDARAETVSGVFPDADPTNDHAVNIDAVAEADITTGVTETTFEPARTVLRDQMASLLIRALDADLVDLGATVVQTTTVVGP